MKMVVGGSTKIFSADGKLASQNMEGGQSASQETHVDRVQRENQQKVEKLIREPVVLEAGDDGSTGGESWLVQFIGRLWKSFDVGSECRR